MQAAATLEEEIMAGVEVAHFIDSMDFDFISHLQGEFALVSIAKAVDTLFSFHHRLVPF